MKQASERRHWIGDPQRSIQTVAPNPRGRDFVAGDVHGSFGLLREALHRVAFDHRRDRLFFVGDLVNRGSQCHEAAHWLSWPFVYGVRGNHEQSFIDWMAHERGDLREVDPAVLPGGPHHALMRRWTQSMSDADLKDMDRRFRQLPLAIEIEAADGRPPCLVVHSDVPVGLTWRHFRHEVRKGSEFAMHYILFDRTRQSLRIDDVVSDVDRVFCGHSTYLGHVRDARLGNVINLDTGTVYAQEEVAGRRFRLDTIDRRVNEEGPAVDPGTLRPALSLYEVARDVCAVRLESPDVRREELIRRGMPRQALEATP